MILERVIVRVLVAFQRGKSFFLSKTQQAPEQAPGQNVGSAKQGAYFFGALVGSCARRGAFFDDGVHMWAPLAFGMPLAW